MFNGASNLLLELTHGVINVSFVIYSITTECRN
ncbi:hypothetical protein YPPY53_1901, partial [Yersinia pestis PY-53]